MGQSRLIVVRHGGSAVSFCATDYTHTAQLPPLLLYPLSRRMEYSYQAFVERVSTLQRTIAETLLQYGRPADDATLMPVTKTHPATAALWAARAGLSSIGENRVQEAQAKQPEASGLIVDEALPPLRWELIGHLQSNKAKLAAELFHRIQSVDSPKLILLLERHAAELDKQLPILLQINAGRDSAKFGAAIEDAPALLEAALRCTHLRLDGLMTIAPLSADPATAERTFATLRSLRDTLQTQFATPLPTLSMGMSSDFALALKHGSTLIRIGTALFGSR